MRRLERRQRLLRMERKVKIQKNLCRRGTHFVFIGYMKQSFRLEKMGG
jgi:hypothetical protein